jgi:hypothetical protein
MSECYWSRNSDTGRKVQITHSHDCWLVVFDIRPGHYQIKFSKGTGPISFLSFQVFLSPNAKKSVLGPNHRSLALSLFFLFAEAR